MKWWWLSFCDPQRSEGERFIGICLLRAFSMIEAAKAAWALGCNPGGDVIIVEIPSEDGSPPAGYVERLLQIEQIHDMMTIWSPRCLKIRFPDVRSDHVGRRRQRPKQAD